MNNEEDARDAVQDAFLSAHRGLANFDGTSRLSTWLHRIAVNAALMKVRANSVAPSCRSTRCCRALSMMVIWPTASTLARKRRESAPTQGDARLVPRFHQSITGIVPYRFASSRHRRYGHRFNSPPSRRDRRSGEDSFAPGPTGAAKPARPPRSRRRCVTCREFIDFLIDYHDGNLPPCERGSFRSTSISAPIA